MATDYPEQSADAFAPPEAPLPDWWPHMGGPTIPWHDDDAGRNSALSIGAEHNRLMDAFVRLADSNGGGFVGMLRGMLAEYATRGLISAGDKQRLNAMLDALRGPDAMEAIATVKRLHEEAEADPAAKPAALAVSAVAAASVQRPDTDAAIDTGSGVAHQVAHTVADLGGAVVGIPFGAPITLELAVLASMTADRHTVHVEVSIQ